MKNIILSLLLLTQSFALLGSEEPSAKKRKITQYLALSLNGGEAFKISFEAAKLSGFLKDMTEENEEGSAAEETEAILLANPNLASNALSQVSALCEAQLRGETLDMDLNIKDVFDLFEATEFLLIDVLSDFIRKKIFNIIMQNPYEEIVASVSYDINFERLLGKFFPLVPLDYRRSANFKDEVAGPDEYKVLYYSIKYPVYNLEKTLAGHTSEISSANLSSDGRRIVTGSSDNTAKIWDASSGELLHNLAGHTSRVWSANFSPDGRMIVTGSDDNIAKIWDAETGELLHNFEGHTSEVRSAIFSPDSLRVVTASYDGTVKIWKTLYN